MDTLLKGEGFIARTFSVWLGKSAVLISEYCAGTFPCLLSISTGNRLQNWCP